MDFETATRSSRRNAGPGTTLASFFRFYRPQLLVCLLVVSVLAGGAYYASRASESAPRVVYSFALKDAKAAAEQPLLVNINEADVERLDELPEVGPSTAETIVEFREANGPFRTVDDLDAVPGIGPATLAKIKPLATV